MQIWEAARTAASELHWFLVSGVSPCVAVGYTPFTEHVGYPGVGAASSSCGGVGEARNGR